MNSTSLKPRLTQEQIKKYLTNPEIVILEILFVILTISNVFVLYRILLNICPFPVIVTWFQLFFGLAFAYILGEVGREFPKFSFFPPLTIETKLYEGLAIPTLVYLGVITMANVLLHKIPTVAVFPVVVSFAVTLHHISRFLGCGQFYLPVRWISLGIMVAGFSLNAFDKKSMENSVFPVAVVYAMFSAVFRAWCLEKAMHVCNGRGNVLHNHKVVMGICILPFVALFFNEWGFFSWMPTNFFLLNTWQVWGCLVTAGTLPFMKNVVANRMIRHTGQAPWRVLEIVSMILIFVIGAVLYDSISIISGISFILVVSGRFLGMLDALSKDPNERRRAMRMQTVAEHGATLPPQYNYDPTGVAESFEQIELPKSSVFNGPNTETNMESLKSSSHTLSQPFSTNPLL